MLYEVITIYNPRSHTRIQQLDTAIDILLTYQSPQTPVGIVNHRVDPQHGGAASGHQYFLRHR